MDILLKDIKEYVFSLLQERLASEIIYHNYAHTFRVVKKLEELTQGEATNKKDTLLLNIAAWFHDVRCF